MNEQKLPNLQLRVVHLIFIFAKRFSPQNRRSPLCQEVRTQLKGKTDDWEWQFNFKPQSLVTTVSI